MFRDFFSPILQQIRCGNEQIINQIKEGQKLYCFRLSLHIPLIEPNDGGTKKDLHLEEDFGEEHLTTHLYLLRKIYLSYVPPNGCWIRVDLTKNSIGGEYFEVSKIKLHLDENFKDEISIINTHPKKTSKRSFEETHLNKQMVEDSIDQFKTFGWEVDTYKDHYT